MSTILQTENLQTDELNRLWQSERATKKRYAGNDYAMVMLQRATHCDQLAWAHYHATYNVLIYSWIRHISGSTIEQEELQNIASDSWERFAKQMTPAKLEHFHTYPAVLRYLKLCVRSATIDAIRIQQRCAGYEELSLDETICSIEQPDADPSDSLYLDEIKAMILRLLRSEDERLLASLMFFQSYSVSEVVQLHPERFPNATKTYQAIRSVRNRLRTNKEFLRFLSDQDSDEEVQHAS